MPFLTWYFLIPIFISSFPLHFIHLFPPPPSPLINPTTSSSLTPSSCQHRLEDGPRNETCSYHFLITMALVTISSVTTAITNPNVNVRGGKTTIKVAFFIKLKLSGPLTQLKNVHTLQHNFSNFFLPIVNNKKKDLSLILMKKVRSVPSADSCLFIFPAKNKQINHIHST